MDEIKNSEKGQELIQEGKQIYSQINQSEKFKQLKQQGLSLVDAAVCFFIIFINFLFYLYLYLYIYFIYLFLFYFLFYYYFLFFCCILRRNNFLFKLNSFYSIF